jgi:hypothetical protein
MNSPGHKANILGDYNYVGIGTGSQDGYLYVTVVFMKKGSTPTPATTTTISESPGTTQASSPDTTTPTTAATTTTVAPTTTTTMIVGPDKAVVPGRNCVEAGRFGQLCHN